jgi:hypothetical protein
MSHRTSWVLRGTAAIVFASLANPARAHGPDHVRARLLCTSDGKGVRDGGRTILDHDVTCSITVDDDHVIQVDAAQVTVTAALPFGSSSPVVQPANQDAARWTGATFTSGTDFLRCEVTTFAGELRAHGDVVWSGALTVRPACPRPRVAPTVACGITMPDEILEDVNAPRPSEDDPDEDLPPEVLRCTITVPRAPAVPLRGVIARAAPSHGAVPSDFDLVDDGHGRAGGHGDLQIKAAWPRGDRHCPPSRIDAVVWTADGAILWSGHVSADVGCQ